MIAAACFLAVLLALGYLWHRDRTNLLARHAATIRELRADRLEAEQDAEGLKISAVARMQKLQRQAREIARLDNTIAGLREDIAATVRECGEHQQDAERFHPLPTIDGCRVDVLATIDSLRDGQVHRVDFGAADNPPIFAETLAGVTPITAAKKRGGR